jgi:predicted phage gp36 major capsid-like protein
MIMGYPVARMEDVPTLANGSLSLAFGDLKQAYRSSIARASACCAIPHLQAVHQVLYDLRVPAAAS